MGHMFFFPLLGCNQDIFSTRQFHDVPKIMADFKQISDITLCQGVEILAADDWLQFFMQTLRI